MVVSRIAYYMAYVGTAVVAARENGSPLSGILGRPFFRLFVRFMLQVASRVGHRLAPPA